MGIFVLKAQRWSFVSNNNKLLGKRAAECSAALTNLWSGLFHAEFPQRGFLQKLLPLLWHLMHGTHIPQHPLCSEEISKGKNTPRSSSEHLVEVILFSGILQNFLESNPVLPSIPLLTVQAVYAHFCCMLDRGRVLTPGKTGTSSHPYPSSLTHTGCFPLNALSVAVCLLYCSLFMSSLQTALCCLCSPVHTQSTYQHPASHFVFLRAPTGLDSQVLPVPRQKLHPLDTILSSNYLNRGAGMGKNFGAYLCWNCMLNRTCTQINIRYTLMCFVQQQCVCSVRVSSCPLCRAATPTQCLSPVAAFPSPQQQQSGPVFWCWAVGCANVPCADLASQNFVCTQGCVQPCLFLLQQTRQSLLVGTAPMGKQHCSLSPVSEPTAQDKWCSALVSTRSCSLSAMRRGMKSRTALTV